jgi:hypothetical protein
MPIHDANDITDGLTIDITVSPAPRPNDRYAAAHVNDSAWNSP